MTARLYYDDASELSFDASVRRVERRADRQAVWLDRSAFYPTSGGQPFDTGTLGDARVLEVVDEDDDVVHIVEGVAAIAEGDRLTGRIDARRRFDHMQQHTGQHVLSAAFVSTSQLTTISFHLGSDTSTIDLAREATPSQIAAAEEAANRIVWDDRPVSIRYASAEDAAALPLRKESRRSGTLRLIDVEGIDLSACGGTHVSRTGAIGAIAVSGWERFKGGTRVEFVCGARALTRFRQFRDQSAACVRHLSVLPQELPDAIARLQADLRDERKAQTVLRGELARYQAETLVASARPAAGCALAAAVVDGDASVLKTLASAVVSRPGLVAVLVSTTAPHALVVARSADVAFSSDAVVKSVAAAFGGRGGGRPELAQAGGLSGPADAILEAACRDLPSD